MQDFILAGFWGAIVSTLPIGPLNLALVLFALQGRYHLWWSSVIGVVLADSLLAFAAIWGIRHFRHWFESPKIQMCWTAGALLGSGILMIGIGIRLWFYLKDFQNREIDNNPSKLPRGRVWLAFLWFFVLTLLEPGLLPFWVAWWLGILSSHTLEFGSQALLWLGILAGDCLIFSFYRLIARQFVMKDQRLLLTRSIQISLIFVLTIAAILIGRFFYFLTSHNEVLDICVSSTKLFTKY